MEIKSAYWTIVGAAVGLVCGLAFGLDYALAGGFIGLAGGTGIWLVMRGRERQRR